MRDSLTADRIGLWLGPLAAAATYWLVPADTLTTEAHRLSAVLALTIVWWLTEPIPIPITGLAAVALAVFLGAVPAGPDGRVEAARTVLAPFADPSVYFLMGGLFIGRAMSRHGLDRRVAVSILCTDWAGRRPMTLLVAVGMSVGLISMWISNTAATAMVFPVTIGVITVLAESGGAAANFERSAFASTLLLATAYCSSIGGVATPIGTATNVVAMGFFRRPEYLNQRIDFFRWSILGVPMMIAIFAGLMLWLRWQSPPPKIDMSALRDYFRAQRAKFGPLSRGEINTLLVFVTVVGLWVTPGILALVADDRAQQWFSLHFPEEICALLAPVLLFLLPVDFKARKFSLEIEDIRKLDWGTMLLFGAGLSLGSLMFKTGLAAAIGQLAFDALGTRDVGAITALAIAAAILLSEFTSNAATVSTLIPVVMAICKNAAIDPTLPLMGTTFAASFGSALPVSTPPNAIVYGSGLVPVRRMIRAGIGLDLIAGLIIWLVLMAAGRLGWSPVDPG